MTWTKLSDDFPDDFYRDDLSDAAFRTHVEGLCWSNRHLLDGWLRKKDLMRFAFTDDPRAAVLELVAAGYWDDAGDTWHIVHHLEHQDTRDQAQRRRKVSTERKRRHREKQLREAEARMSRRDETRDETRDPGRVGTGRDGTGTEGEAPPDGSRSARLEEVWPR